MPIPPFYKPDYLAEARSRVTEQFKLPEQGIVVEIPQQSESNDPQSGDENLLTPNGGGG